MFRIHLQRRRLGGVATLALAAAIVAPVGVVAATTSVPLHQAHIGTVADCGLNGILWHFVLNKLDPGTPSGTVTATFANTELPVSDAGEPAGNGTVQHFWIATESGDTLLGASASVADQSGSPSLVLSHWECGEATPATPPSNPPGNPPSNPPNNPPSNPPSGEVGGSSGAVRQNTLGSSSSGPAVTALPDTAMNPSATSLLLVLGVMLVGATATLVTATVRAENRRRR